MTFVVESGAWGTGGLALGGAWGGADGRTRRGSTRRADGPSPRRRGRAWLSSDHSWQQNEGRSPRLGTVWPCARMRRVAGGTSHADRTWP